MTEEQVLKTTAKSTKTKPAPVTELATETENVTVTASTEEKAEEKEVETVIYAGPSIKNLQQYTIFNNGIPSILKEDIKACPAIKGLIVPVAKLAETEARMIQQGTREFILKTRVTDYAGSVK